MIDDERAELDALETGDVVVIGDILPEFAFVVENGAEPAAVAVRSQELYKIRGVGARETAYDAILGVDAHRATHVFDADGGRVDVYERSSTDHEFSRVSRQNVDREQIPAYLRWVENDQCRAWDRQTVSSSFRDALRTSGRSQNVVTDGGSR